MRTDLIHNRCYGGRMLNDPELLMQFAREKQEELRRTMQSTRRSSFRRMLIALRRPARTAMPSLRSARRGA
jgi:hypothetical protein